jgi:diguanylate cyclase (GGDEF)-like protein/putative nucleotidyltransferase with HDIG domain
MGCTAILVQCFYRDRPSTLRVVFNVCASAVAIAFAWKVFHVAVSVEHGDGISLPLLAASSAYFLANTLPVAAVISLTEAKPLKRIWSECYFWSFPYYLAGAAIAGLVGWVDRVLDWQTSLLVLPTVYLIYRSYRLYLGKLENEKRHVEEMANLHLRTIEALALAIEAKDHTTHDHLQRVRVYAVEVGKELGLSPEEMEALHAAALLHDIGKLAVPEHIISKPGKLTREEFEKVKIHPVVGAEILERVRFPYPVVPIVRAHHEKWDGTGYPQGLKGEEIPIGARILSAVDFMDALASDRQYRPALALDEVMGALEKGAGSAFDPKVVEVLKRRYQDLEKLVQNSSGQIAWTKLSTEVRIQRHATPDTGLQETSARSPRSSAKFLASISAARQEAQTLFELSQDLGASLSLGETLSVFSVKLKRLVPYDSIAIYIARSGELVPEHTGGDNFRQLAALRIPMGEGLSGWVAMNREPIINGNPLLEPGYAKGGDGLVVLRSALVIPLEGVEGIVGVLAVYRSEPEAFTADHLRILLAISSKMALALENALKYQQAESSATTDYLTGLPNARSLFLHLDRELARSKRSNSPITVMVCDLDGFKQVNDRFGHLEGNRVLETFAQKLKDACRGYDYVARMGGDEFVVVAPGLTAEGAQAKIASLRQLARVAGVEICGKDILSLSIGRAVYPENGLDAEQLLAEADRSMYKEKKQYRKPPAAPRPLFRVAVRLLPEGSTVPILGSLAAITPSSCDIETGAVILCGSKVKIFYSAKEDSLQNEGTVTASDPGSSIEVRFAESDDPGNITRIIEHLQVMKDTDAEVRSVAASS